jgi:hypothetical protein
MKARSLINALVLCSGFAAAVTAHAQDIRISAAYGGGGNSGANVNADFVELRNRTSSPINLSGLSLQYTSAGGTTWSSATNQFLALNGTIPANGFFLVRLAVGTNTTGAAQTPLPVTPDQIGTIAMGGAGGKIALVNGVSLLSGACPTTVIDLVNYGAGNCDTTAATSNSQGVLRNNDGCTDNNENDLDFTVVTIGGSGGFLPRNSLSGPGASCGVSIVDCNGNGIDDAIDVLDPALDCNNDDLVDSCQITSALDCNANSIIDSCEINANGGVGGIGGTLDTNSNGQLDSCEGSPLTSIIISEVVDGPQTGGLPKYVELTNLGSTDVTFGANDFVRLYANGSLTATQNYSLNGVVIPAGTSYTIANNGGGTVLPPTQWVAAYGPFNVPSAYGSPSFINGDDALRLERGTTVVDAFGVVGEGATGPGSIAWGYSDSFARRNPNVCAPNATFTLTEWVLPGNNTLEEPLIDASTTNANAVAAWNSNLGALTNPNNHQRICGGSVNDCNGNGREDTIDVVTFGFADCNGNLVPDSCDIANGLPDCNFNGIPDSCEILAGTVADINGNGRPDTCDAVLFDCNANGVEDAADITAGTSQDCNGNTIPDECEPLIAIDANANGIGDLCEGAFVGETAQNATVQTAGVRALANGAAFFNVQGIGTGPTPSTFASYGGVRWDIAPIVAQFDAAYGAGQWAVTNVYVQVIQSNAAFTTDGAVEIFLTDNDTINFTPAAAVQPPIYPNFATDFTDLQSLVQYNFVEVANGTVEVYSLFDSATPTPGGTSLASEIQAADDAVSVVFRDSDATVAATYAGFTNNTYLGPTLIVFAAPTTGPTCPECPADFDQDGGVTGADVEAFFLAFESGDPCGDTDLDGGVTGADVEAFFIAFENGGC